MPAFNAARYGLPFFKELYGRLTARGKTKMQAYVAIQNKLLVLVRTLWRKDEEYDTGEINIRNQQAGVSPSGCCAAA